MPTAKRASASSGRPSQPPAKSCAGERLDAVFGARTLGELEPPLADLPRAERDHYHHVPLFTRAPLLVLVAVLVMAWALTGAGAFWPIWVLLGLWWFPPLRHGHRWMHGRRSVL